MPFVSVSPTRCVVPAGHSAHRTAPVVLTYLVPPWYEQGTHVACPDLELDDPTSHGKQAFASPPSRYFPGEHGSHTPNTVETPSVVFLRSSRT